MERSTNNFDSQLVIGSGGYGTVYKGDIDGGETTVAVKRSKPGSSQGENEFWMEIKMLSTHRHENLLSLIGYCNEEIAHLSLGNEGSRLLQSYNAKIADFGLARQVTLVSQSHVNTDSGHLYVKSDVYTLVEMLTVLRVMDTKRPSNQFNLIDWIKPYLSERRKLKDKIDSRLGGKYPSRAAVHEIAQLALSCLGNEPKCRPSMKKVVEKLQQIETANEEYSCHS